MRFSRVHSDRLPRLVLAATFATLLAGALFAQGSATSNYTVYSGDTRRPLAVRTQGGIEVVSLDQVATIFGLSIAEDTSVGGLTVRGKSGQSILLIPGQSFASVGGKVVQLPGQVQRDRNAWQVPLDFVRIALGPALGQRVEIRKPSRLVLVGDVRVPQVGGHLDKQATGARLVIDVNPPTPSRVNRDGNRITVTFDATALDAQPITGATGEFVAATRIDGTSLIIDLGPQAATVRTDDRSDARVTVDMLPPGPPPPPPPKPAPEPPVVDIATPGVIRTIVIDPGHGGDDAGAKGIGNSVEKDITLQIARRLKATIESRIGLRVLLTRDGDENVPLDRRTSMANNNKADLFISLHVNASTSPHARGAQVLSLSLQEYKSRTDAAIAQDLPVPVVGGGVRSIDVVPWELAQLPYANRSAAVAAILVRFLAERKVPLYARPAAQLPLRPLVGANMPAVLVELGFLTNAEDARALTQAEPTGAIIDALVAMVSEVRRGIPAPGRRP
ncbi:MAG TPA: N-acetylmuramoyl-L-alanine amidase [Vicinamibacterales bacterium]|nr:N-acetylmuramoyl-L-alanine amidase [Vicinamibacterales bacterium]